MFKAKATDINLALEFLLSALRRILGRKVSGLNDRCSLRVNSRTDVCGWITLKREMSEWR